MIQQAYGSWPSQIRADQLATAARRLSQPRLDGGEVYWLEGRAAEGGRQVVMQAPLDSVGTPREFSPDSVNVRTRVHEYGGGDFSVHQGRLAFVDFADQRIYLGGSDGHEALSLPGPRYADLVISPEGRWLFAVEERHAEGVEPENRLVVFELPRVGEGVSARAPRVIAEGFDFYSFPAVSPDESQLAFTAWRHPNMPWDSTVLFCMPWSSQGPAGEPRWVAGGEDESVFQPRFSPQGRLTFVSDRSGWWNLYQCRDEKVFPLCPREEEFGLPQWVFGLSRYDFITEGEILCAHGRPGQMELSRLSVDSGVLRGLGLPYQDYSGIGVKGGQACLVADGFDRPSCVLLLDLEGGGHREVAYSSSSPLAKGACVVPEAIEFASADGRTAYGWYYEPRRSDVSAPPGERPPLVVKSHGGPTASANPGLDPRMQFWVDRGIAVVDVDYGGSSGYGRAYRKALEGQWGVVDVEDCASAALSLAEQGHVDSSRLAISGGSAGGYTTLCALTFTDVFAAGASHYGIGDLEALARETHKFEARYLDGLVGPYPEEQALYRSRSPIHFPDRLSCPVIFFQGLEDEVVPPGQAEAMVAALAEQGIPHAYVPFEGEQHGFRRAENIAAALEGELYFYGEIFGFDSGVAPGRVRIQR